MLIEIHVIQNHSPSNLNRDDTGSPKEAFFGGYRRARISSQCLKRSIRRSPLFKETLGDERSFRTKRLAALVENSLKEQGCDEGEAKRIAQRAGVIGSSEKQEQEAEAAQTPEPTAEKTAGKPEKPARKRRPKSAEKKGLPETKQLIFFNPDEVDSIAQALKEIADKEGASFDKLSPSELETRIAEAVKSREDRTRPIPVEIALFGRMTTSAIFEDVTSTVQVAHAISTHKLDHEFDYFTAVDDLKDIEAGDDAGAGMVGDVEFNSSCYYKYFSVDWSSFVVKVGNEDLAVRAIKGFITALALTAPTGKQNSFAAHNPPDFLMVECKKKKIPSNYANAFIQPATPHGNKDLIDDSISKLSRYVETVAEVYGIEAERFWLATRTATFKGTQQKSLEQLLDSVVKACKVESAKESEA